MQPQHLGWFVQTSQMHGSPPVLKLVVWFGTQNSAIILHSFDTSWVPRRIGSCRIMYVHFPVLQKVQEIFPCNVRDTTSLSPFQMLTNKTSWLGTSFGGGRGVSCWRWLLLSCSNNGCSSSCWGTWRIFCRNNHSCPRCLTIKSSSGMLEVFRHLW
jgi:hypothetical protein